MTALTDSIVKALKPAAERYEVWDSTVSGLGVRVGTGARATVSWLLLYRFKGKSRRMTLGRFPDVGVNEARRIAQRHLAEVQDGIDPAAEVKVQKEAEGAELTVEGLCTEFIKKYARVRKKSWREDERQLQRDVIPALGKVRADAVTRRDLVRLLDRKMLAGSGTAANRLLAVLRKMFAWAVERGELDASPAAGISRQHTERAKDRVLTLNEMCALIWLCTSPDVTSVTPPVKLCLLILACTGQRLGEVLGMRYEELERESDGLWWTIPAERSKNGRAHRAPLTREVRDAIGEIEGKAGLVLPGRRKEAQLAKTTPSHALRDQFTEGMPLHGHQSFTPHDLRRTAGTALSCLGFSRLVVQKVLNHTDRSVTAVYDRYSYATEKREALEKWGDMLWATQHPMHDIDTDTWVFDYEDEWRRMQP